MAVFVRDSVLLLCSFFNHEETETKSEQKTNWFVIVMGLCVVSPLQSSVSDITETREKST